MLSALLLLAWPGRAAAAPWTVPALIDQAQRVSPSIRTAGEEARAAKADRRQAGVLPNPVATAEDAIDWKYSLVQTVELPWARAARLGVADRQAASAQVRADQARLAVKAQVESLAYQLLSVRQQVGLIEDNVRLLARLRATLPARYQAGLKSTAQTLRVDLEDAQTRDELRRLRAQETSTRALLNSFLLMPSSAPLELQGELAPAFPEIDASTLAARALANDAQLRLADSSVLEQEARLRASRASRWPTIDAGPNLNRPRDAAGVLLGGFQAGLALPLWDWKQGDVSAAAARREGARAQAQAQRQALLGDLERLVEAYRSAKDRAEALQRQGLLERAIKIRTQALLAYQQGLLNLTDTLDALRTSTQVQQDYIQSLLDGRQAIIDLETHLGGPL